MPSYIHCALVMYGSDRSYLGRLILVAFLAMILAISCVARYSLCAYQWLFISSNLKPGSHCIQHRMSTHFACAGTIHSVNGVVAIRQWTITGNATQHANMLDLCSMLHLSTYDDTVCVWTLPYKSTFSITMSLYIAGRPALTYGAICSVNGA